VKIALITTVINIPRVLELYRKFAPAVRFFVAGDLKTPLEAATFCRGIPNCVYLAPESQKKWKCSELLSWNNDSRRNIALLEAVAWGADFIFSCDDDMVCMRPEFFQRTLDCEIVSRLTEPFSGLCAGDGGYWFDAGMLTTPKAPQRGLPPGWGTVNSWSFVVDARVGAMQGIILGTPDTDAATMLSQQPYVTGVSDILRNGFVAHLEAKAVMNSQFTAFRRELAPCFAQFYKWQGRNTDILASLIMRRVMRERNLYTYFGPPAGFHARNPHDSFKDLKAEMFGLERVQALTAWLDDYLYLNEAKTPLDMTRRIWEGMTDSIIPRANIDAALAFCDDMEGAL
jgi:hypothetical protein